MSSTFLLRLGFHCIAAGLLLIGLAYYSMSNTTHEWVGTGMFVLVILHNLFNHRWYGMIPRAKREARGIVNILVTLVLATTMLALLITSMMISNEVFSFLALNGGFTAKQVHILAAYWALVIVSIHLGLRWPMLMNVTRTLLGIATSSALRTRVLRIIAVCIAIQGIWSSFELAIGARLSMQMTLEWWDFEQSVAGFFFHCGAVAGLYVVLTHYSVKHFRIGTAARVQPAH